MAFMDLIKKSGYYRTLQQERFLLIQDVLGVNLLSGKDCQLFYYPEPENFPFIDSITLVIAGPKKQRTPINFPKPDLMRDEAPGLGPLLGLIIKAFSISKSGDYSFELCCHDKSGQLISSANFPPLSFQHDIDCWMNNWLPNGLAI
jgi:hypothetical protein